MEELVLSAKAGSKEDFVKLIELNKQSMYKVARSFLQNEEDVADVLQESILKCYSSLAKLREEQYFKTWLIRIVINECKNIISKNKDETVVDEIPDTGVAEGGYGEFEFRELLDSLDAKYSIVLLLYYGEGYNAREIARILGLNEVTVRSRLSRGRKKFLQLSMEDGKGVFYYGRG